MKNTGCQSSICFSLQKDITKMLFDTCSPRCNDRDGQIVGKAGKQFDGNQCLVDALYSDASNVNEEGVQSTWTQVREKYSATVDSEIKELNQKIASLKS